MSKIKLSPYHFLLILAFMAFIALGMPDGLIGVAWPSIRASFDQPHSSMGMLLIPSVVGYILSSFFATRLTRWLGVGRLLAISCLLTGTAILGYTIVPAWSWLVMIAVFLGLGAGAIDASLNTYMASHYAEKQMQWLHASYGIGVALGPIIMTGALANFDNWRVGYMVVGVAQIGLALLFFVNKNKWDQQSRHGTAKKLHEYDTPLRSTLRMPRTYISVGMFFIYVGLEATIGHWGYTFLTEARHISVAVAGIWAGSYWITFTLGRFLAGLLTRRFGVIRLFYGGVILGAMGALLLWLDPFSMASMIGIGLIGFSLAPMYPGLMSLTAARVGEEHAANTIGLQISVSGFGGAVMPGAMGVIAATNGTGGLPVYALVLFGVLLVLFMMAGHTR